MRLLTACHYCDMNGLDFAHRDTMAYQHYIEENGAQREAASFGREHPLAMSPHPQDAPAKSMPAAAPAAPTDTAPDALLAIQELMDGVEWTPDTLERIAEILEGAGYHVSDTRA